MSVSDADGTAVPAVLEDPDAPLRLSFDGPLAVLTLASPPHNLFDDAMWQAWFAAVDWCEQNVPRALLIRAQGRVVSAGVDVRIFRDTPAEKVEEYWRRNLRIVQAVERLPCPTVFAAHALTLTAAFEIALACDFIVAVDGARFGLVERRVAFTPAMGGTQRLAERAGVSRARELVMTGRLYRASTLADWGVVNALFGAATFTDEAHAFASDLATGPTQAHVATKQVTREYLRGGVAAADAVLSAVVHRVSGTEDHRRAVEAFLAHGPDHQTEYLGR
ncbi:enoyl-CoA hydratase/isomerase family protein [Streptomyces sp. NPDC088350]|uniref:enoyl-CoA hydratase/isomerase family protein n=1 Tax=Streptomyces sp. NPDC088350 TaxID=3365854 RepID=UPI003812F871